MAKIWVRNKYGGWFEVDEDEYKATKTNQDLKKYQLDRQKYEADKLNNSLPKRVPLKDVPLVDANKKTDVLDLVTGQRYKFSSNVIGAYAFAGKGSSKEFRTASKYVKRYGGNARDWQHCAGFAKVKRGTDEIDVEVHWAQLENGYIREAFIKERRQ